MCLCISVSSCTHVCAGVCGGGQSVLHLLELELWAVVSPQVRVPGTEPGSSAGTAGTPSCSPCLAATIFSLILCDWLRHIPHVREITERGCNLRRCMLLVCLSFVWGLVKKTGPDDFWETLGWDRCVCLSACLGFMLFLKDGGESILTGNLKRQAVCSKPPLN